jgi:hypothetical protein
MSLRTGLMTEVDKGLLGKNGSIPFPVAKLDEYIEIAKNTNYLFVGDTGSGKSSFTQDLILNILDWYFLNMCPDLKLSIIYFGMERKQYMYSAKWVSRRIFLEEGIYLSPKKILGRKRKKDENGKPTKEYDILTKEEYEKVEFYSKIFDLWESEDTFKCIEGTHNPTGIKIFLDNFAKKHGTITPRIDSDPLSKQGYIPNHDNHIVLVISDYVGIIDEETDKVTGQKKQNLDTYSRIMRRSRDLYSMSPMNVQQLGRAVSTTDRLKMNDLKPKLADIADTSSLARDADVVISIFDPFRYVLEGTERDLLGYDLNALKDPRGAKFYRSLHILKNSFDADGITMGAAFHPFTGIIKSMKKGPKEMTPSDYADIVSGNYFLEN